MTEPHKWPVVRYFERLLSSAWEFLTLASGTPVPFALAENLTQEQAEVIRAKPPSGVFIVPPQLTWEQWCERARWLRRDGWVFCRFALRAPDGSMDFVEGFVRGSFGLWARQMTDQLAIVQASLIGTGTGFCPFADFESAAMACELAEQIIDWSLRPPSAPDGTTAEWQAEMARINQFWAAAEITPAFGVQLFSGTQLVVLKHQPSEVRPKREQLS